MDVNVNIYMEIQNYIMLLHFILQICLNSLFKKTKYEIVLRTTFIQKYKSPFQGIV